MKRIGKRIGIAALIVAMACSFSLDSYATSVEEVKNKINSLQKEKNAIQKEIEALQKETGDITVYIEKLDKKLEDLGNRIADMETQVANTKEELSKNQKELGDAKDDLVKQYDVMKARIQYMYENGSDDYYALLLEAESISQLLNRAEYINKISKYDQNLYGNYEDTVALISNKQKQIENNLATLNTLQQKLESEQEAVNTLIKNKTTQLQEYNKKIAAQKSIAKKKQEEINDQNEVVERLLEEARKKAEEEARKKAEEEKKKAEAAANKKPSTSSESKPVSNSASGLRWPIHGSGRITSTFGHRESPTAGASSYHKGIDIGIPTGTPILASGSGTVVTATYHYAAGNYVMISHGNGLYTVYMHNSSLKVSVGDQVAKGQVIALSGSSGVSTGPHLHFGVNKNGTYVNPLNYVSQP